MTRFAEAVHQTITTEGLWTSPLADIAPWIPKVLKDCDNLRFDTDVEVRAYATLHLVDRYGRVLQVVEHLFQVGRLPLRRSGIAGLEVGAGPAPALYAIRAFYDDLVNWPDRGEDWSTEPLRVSHALDKAPGWDAFLHHLSEELIEVQQPTSRSGDVPFARALEEFDQLDIREIHNTSIASLASSFEAEYDSDEEPISRSTAFGLAYEQGTDHPSAYDLIFLPNFLTQPNVVETFKPELRGLMRSLTPGGVLVLMTGTGHKYKEIQSEIQALAAGARLIAVGPSERFIVKTLNTDRSTGVYEVWARQAGDRASESVSKVMVLIGHRFHRLWRHFGHGWLDCVKQLDYARSRLG
jgi:hypothetical protein